MPGAWCTLKKACWSTRSEPDVFLLKLLLKNAFRHKLRTGLTMVGLVAVSYFL